MRTSRAARLGEIFRCRPSQWGLRGDPALWEELEQALAEQVAPACPQALRKVLLDTITQLLEGRPLQPGEIRFVERYARGGMSSGQVCGDFWHDTAVPLLQRRLAE